jgi:hypothetical protein
MKHLATVISTIAAVVLSASASAATVSWTDWQSSTVDSANGQLLVDGATVDVSYKGSTPHRLVQTAGGIDYWTGSAYTNGSVDNAPNSSSTDLIELNQGGTVTLTFSQAITNPYIAMNSWNGNVVNFDSPITIDSFGRGYWGSGSAINITPTGFTGYREFHGIISLIGTFSSISFTHTSENWHGFTVGVAGLAPPSQVPVPAALFMFAPALLGFLGLRRKAKNTVA